MAATVRARSHPANLRQPKSCLQCDDSSRAHAQDIGCTSCGQHGSQILYLGEGPQTAGQLAGRLRLTTGAVTSVLDRLERKSLIVRSPDSGDRRKIIVTANSDALAGHDNVYRSIGDAYAAMQRRFTISELEFLVRYYQASIEVIRREIARLGS